MFKKFIRETIKEEMDKAKKEIIEEVVKVFEDIFDPCYELDTGYRSNHLVNKFRYSVREFIRKDIHDDVNHAIQDRIEFIDRHIQDELKDINSEKFLNDIIQRINKMQLKGE